MKSTTSSCGFSLVEIAFSMGIISFSIVAILGLLSAGLNSSKSSLDESLIAAMSRQVIGSLRQQRFTDNPVISNLITEGQAVYYFDANGVRMQLNGSDIDKATALQQRAVYQCLVAGGSDFQHLGPQPPGAAPSPCLLNLTLTFQWPIQAQKPNSFSMRTSLAKYY